MKIAQVAPLRESVPPHFSGATERIVSYLTESLVALGHEVTLFASVDSKTAADLYASVPRSLRIRDDHCDPIAGRTIQLAEIARQAHRFDIIHFHTAYDHFPLFRYLPTPHITTLHGRLDLADLPLLFAEFSEVPVVSISNSQRTPIPKANWLETVYHGIPSPHDAFQSQVGSYFAFVGQISPEHGVERAIEIALRLEMPLQIAARIDPANQAYFDSVIRPLLSHPLIEFLGEVNEQVKKKLLDGARALVYPIDWPVPFGLVMIEAMACGTPVIAFRSGSVEEVMREGVSGFIVNSVEEAIEAGRNIEKIDRHRCRRYFENRFTDDRMAIEYVAVYKQVVKTAKGRKSRCNDPSHPTSNFRLEPTQSHLEF